MNRPTRNNARYVALALATLATIASASTARADHSADERATDDSPYILRPGEARIGLTKSQLGLGGHPILRRIELGTHHLPWILAATGARTYNAHAKVLLYRGERLALGAGVGHTFIGFGDEPGGRLRVTPVEANLALELNRRLTLTSSLVHTQVDARGMMERPEDAEHIDEVWAAAGSTTTQVRAGLEIRLSKRTAFQLGARVIAGQTLRAETGASEAADEDTTVSGTAMAESKVIDMRGDVTGSAAVHWSWEHFNLELGVQYGSVSIPGLNLALPARTVTPKLDLYWRF